MVRNEELAKAVAAIPQRSEKQNDPQKLTEAFVDPGILPQLQNINSQIMYGRRGTGKTHILKVLKSTLEHRPKTCVIYMDARTFGSTSQFSDSGIPLPRRCTALFQDLSAVIYNDFRSFAIREAGDNISLALEQVEALGLAATEPTTQARTKSVTEKHTSKAANKANAQFSLNFSSPSIGGQIGSDEETGSERTTSYKVEHSDKILFPSVSVPVEITLSLCDARLFILIDEWSSLPTDVQPYLSELIKRSFLPLSGVSIKIASLEHRSNFCKDMQNGLLGLKWARIFLLHLILMITTFTIAIRDRLLIHLRTFYSGILQMSFPRIT